MGGADSEKKWSFDEQWSWDPPSLERLDLTRASVRAEFRERYLDVMDGREPMARILEIVGHSEQPDCFVERDYIDRDYRDELANFYAQTFRTLHDRCQRLHFMSRATEEYLGFTILRPIPGRLISRTMLAPPPILRRYVSCKAPVLASPYGGKLEVSAAPFISQDSQYGVCAHAAIWMVSQYFNLRFGGPRHHMSEIVKTTGGQGGRQRMTPSRGLTSGQVIGVLDALGMLPLNYQLAGPSSAANGRTSEADAHEIARCYLNSGIPLILNQGRHARVLVGYFHDQDGNRIYIAHDDTTGPYQLFEGFAKADSLLVPFPGRIYLEPHSAETAAEFHFNELIEDDPVVKERISNIPEDAFQLRAYVTEIAEYRERLVDRGLKKDARRWLNLSTAPHWVWVVELQDRRAAAQGKTCVIGEMVVDATTNERNAHVLFGLMPGTVYRWSEPKRGKQSDRTTEQVELYGTGCAIHSPESIG